MSSDPIDILATVPLLAGLDRRHLERLSRDFSERSFAAGATIVREGEGRGIGFFVVADGEAIVSVAGREVARLGPGAYFGEVALISDRVRTATVTAATGLRCYVMTVWDFRAFVQGNADVAWRLLQHLAGMLHQVPGGGAEPLVGATGDGNAAGPPPS